MSMTSAEKKILHSYIDSSVNYLEFGAGESTIYASSVSTILTITSVDSSKHFVNNNLKHNPDIKNALLNGKLKFHLVDIGETVDWGFPKNTSKRHLWPNYSLSVFCTRSKHDIILIDGRFRVACTLNCILNSPPNSTLLIHDFWNRPEYHIVLKFLEIEYKADTLGVFKKKDKVDHHQIQSLIKVYQYYSGDRIFPILQRNSPGTTQQTESQEHY